LAWFVTPAFAQNAYITNGADSNVAVINTATDMVTTQITLPPTRKPAVSRSRRMAAQFMSHSHFLTVSHLLTAYWSSLRQQTPW
jgi:YVTN family beta-propeller protein